MSLDEVLAALRRAGNEGFRQVCLRHGAREPLFGVPWSELHALQRRIRTDHALARQLWDTRNHDARVLATLIGDPRRLTEAQLEEWLHDCSHRLLLQAFAQLAGRSRVALECARRWIDDTAEFRQAAGWTVLAIHAQDAAVGDGVFAPLLPRIERTIHEAPNFARHAMNSCLIAIGGRGTLQGRALRVARRIGAVAVEHGDTGGETPVAVDSISAMRARGAKARKARPTRAAGRKRAASKSRTGARSRTASKTRSRTKRRTGSGKAVRRKTAGR